MTRIDKVTTITAAFALLATFAQPAMASSNRHMTISSTTSAPIGHVRFCNRHPAECAVRNAYAPMVRLTSKRFDQLTTINDFVNQSVRPVTDQDLYRVAEHWTYPNTSGDCEDYALLKRRQLIQRGWPAGALMITVVRETNGNGHAVLTVRTDKGDLILDNLRAGVTHWYKTPYRFLKRQSGTHSGRWMAIIDRRSARALRLAAN
jgi:predicted transglutaminase-like cysteine proteinase